MVDIYASLRIENLASFSGSPMFASGDQMNIGGASFTVHVQGAVEQLDELLSTLTGIGPGTSLADKIARTHQYVATNALAGACSKLTAFGNEVRALRPTNIPPIQAATLIGNALQIKTVLGC
jgi:hypothetical protein